MRRSLSSIAAALLLVRFLVGCSDATDGSSVGKGASASSSVGSKTVALPAERTTVGDYDPDDYEVDRDDGDNDDSSMPTDRDNDSDSTGTAVYDRDDARIRNLGHVASAAQLREVTKLVRRYFTAAVEGDGATACSLLVFPLAKTVPEDIGQPPGPPYLSGTTCPAVLTKVFELNRRQLAADLSTLSVIAVRIEREGGLAVLAFRGRPIRDLRVAREDGAWKVDRLLDDELP